MTRPISWSVSLLIGGVFGTLSTLATIGDPDLWWHLAQGRQTVEHGLARIDQLSWTVNGMPVLTDQWLGQVVWYAAYATLGWTGVILLRGILVAGITGLIVLGANVMQRQPIIALLASLPAIALTRFGWTERPQLIGLFLFVALTVLIRAIDARPRLLVAVPALMLLWANLHGSFALGLGVFLITSGELALRRAELRRLIAITIVATLAATLVTPSGISIWTSAGGHFLSPPRVVQEEGVPDVTEPYGRVFALVLLMVMATAALARTAPLREAALILPVLFVSMTAARHTPFFAVASAPYLAAFGPDAVRALAARLRVQVTVPPLAQDAPRPAVTAVIAVGAIVAVVAGALIARAEPNVESYPAGVLSRLPPGPGLLNDYDWGGFLIWYAPATPVFIDGRLFPYTGQTLADYETVVSVGPTWREVLTRRGVRALLVKPRSPIAVRARDLGWPIVVDSTRYVLVMVPNSR